MSVRKLLKFYEATQRDNKDVFIEVSFDQEPGCHGGCGTYDLIIEYPVDNGNCTLDSPIIYTLVDEIAPSGMACCSGYLGKVAHVSVDTSVPMSMYDEAISVREFIKEFGPREIVDKISERQRDRIFKAAVDTFNAGNSSAPGTMVWAQGKGRFHRSRGDKPWRTIDECLAADKYTKNHLYFMAEAMGIKVNSRMSKPELCQAIVNGI